MTNISRSKTDHNTEIYIYPISNVLSLLRILALVIMVCMLVSCKGHDPINTPQVSVTSVDTLATKAANDTLQSQYNASRVQIDGLISKTSELDSVINKKDAEIARLRGRIYGLEKNNKQLTAKLKKANKLIESLRDEMKEKVRSLWAEGLGMMENDKNRLSMQLDAMNKKYNDLKELGSVLHASNIRIMAIHINNHGKREKKTRRARKADELKMYFDIDENRIAEDGTKKLYLVIKDPEGHLLSNTSSGSMNIKGKPMNYSLIKEIKLKQDERVKDVSTEWVPDDDLEKGEYSVAIYNGGYKIGDGKVVLN